MSTSIFKALSGKLDFKRHLPSILYISASLAMSTSVVKDLPGLGMSTSILKDLRGKLDLKRHLPSILYVSASLAMSTCFLKALPRRLDITKIENYVIIASLKRETLSKLIKRIPGLRLLISKLPGLTLRMHVESLGKPRNVNKCFQSLAW